MASEGYPFVIGAVALAVVAFVLALRLRAWPIWLVAYALVLLAIVAGWMFRDTGRLA
jgi:uncharacterized membrane protein